jgi:Holliday junction resolvase RusA-like endonuclease
MPRNVCDIDNRLKALHDALEGFCYSNDKQIRRETTIKTVCKGREGFELTAVPKEEFAAESARIQAMVDGLEVAA